MVLNILWIITISGTINGSATTQSVMIDWGRVTSYMVSVMSVNGCGLISAKKAFLREIFAGQESKDVDFTFGAIPFNYFEVFDAIHK